MSSKKKKGYYLAEALVECGGVDSSLFLCGEGVFQVDAQAAGHYNVAALPLHKKRSRC